jgi:hypothetical protein
MLGPKFGNAGTKSHNRVAQVQHSTVKPAQLEVCGGVRYTKTDLRRDLKHQYLMAHLPAVAHAAHVTATSNATQSLGTNPTVSPDPDAPMVWTKERGKKYTKIDLPPTYTTAPRSTNYLRILQNHSHSLRWCSAHHGGG